jgi:hypothetical protein
LPIWQKWAIAQRRTTGASDGVLQLNLQARGNPEEK